MSNDVNNPITVEVGGIKYTPEYGPDGLDQFGWDRNGIDIHGRRRDGKFTDPIMDGPQQAAAKIPRQARGKKMPGVIKAMDGSGRTIGECWHDLLLANETARPQHRMTDPELEKAVAELFPESYVRPAPKARRDYNCGQLPCQKGKKPPIPAHRYLRVDGTLYRMNSRGGVAQQWDLQDVILGEAARKK